MIISMLPDGKRLHLQHGPIDLIIEAFGSPCEVAKAYDAAATRFETILEELVEELPKLRRIDAWNLKGTTACRMQEAVAPHNDDFITPMAAVAGAVADEMLDAMKVSSLLEKAYVNNGGDIALYINPRGLESFATGIVSDPHTGKLITTATITAEYQIGGIATSGWHGRSHSLGIADSVTVFAENAAIADAAATMIANEVNLPGCEKIDRCPAKDLSPDSDLGYLPVTVAVKPLDHAEITAALFAGKQKAEILAQAGIIKTAFLSLQGNIEICYQPFDAIGVFEPHSFLQKKVSSPFDWSAHA